MLRLFGHPQVTNAGPLHARHAFVIAAMVDLEASRKLSRADLAAALWPGKSATDASNNLRQVFSEIRRWELETDRRVLEIDGSKAWRTYQTEPSDVSLFLQLSAVENADALMRMNDLYAGELLGGVDTLEGDAGIWLMSQRDRLQTRYVNLAVAGCLRVRSQLALDVLDRLSFLAPYDENVARAKLVVCAQLGGRVRVEEAYERFSQRLATELGSSPDESTTGLFRELVSSSGASFGRPITTRFALSSVPRILILPPQSAVVGGLSQTDAILGASLIDEVTHSLSRASTFAVFAPHTARQLSAQPFQGGQPYGADYLVSTSIVPGGSGERRLTFRLTDLASHEVQLSEEISFTRDNLAAGHFAMAAGLAARFVSRIERTELAQYRASGSASAYVHYLLGCEALRVADLPRVRRARKHFSQAVRLSPSFARSRSMLARTLSMEYLLLGRKDVEPLGLALSHAKEALREAPGDPLMHLEVGHALIYLDSLDEAVETLQTAADLGPHFADVLCTFADSLIHIGRHPEARPLLDRALSLNPLPPDWYYWISATSHFLLSDYASTIESIGKMQAPASAGRISAAAEALAGNLKAAYKHRDGFMARNPTFRLDEYVFPIRNAVDRDHLIFGLRVAGFT